MANQDEFPRIISYGREGRTPCDGKRGTNRCLRMATHSARRFENSAAFWYCDRCIEAVKKDFGVEPRTLEEHYARHGRLDLLRAQG